MVTLTNPHNVWNHEYVGKSTDTKPIQNVPNGSSFLEMDTSKEYRFDADSSQWIEATAASAVAVVG